MEADMNPYKTLLLSLLLIGVFACKADNLVLGEGYANDLTTGGQTGVSDTGGNPGAGGSFAMGGMEDLGGSVSSGGEVLAGGAVASGGQPDSTGAGGAMVLPSGNIVTFANGMARGAMTGVGWVAMGTVESLVSPTCAGAPITNAAPCTTTRTVWNNPSALCVTGMIPALPAVPTAVEYATNWGIQVGASAGNFNSVVGLSFSAITVFVTGSPATGLRAELHRLGDPDSTFYCANLMSGAKIPVTAFNTSCWDGSGTALTLADAPRIDKISVQVSSVTLSPIPVNNLCLTRIVFGN
jgi:hypothetical protein